MSELKPCPFCGKQPVSLVTSNNSMFIGCNHGISALTVYVLSDPETSVLEFNSRPIEDALKAELKATDALLKEATETIGSVIACCTYDSNNDAKIGIYGIDEKAFTKIDQFITHYNDAVSAGKVSLDVKRELSDAEINELGAREAEKRDKK